MKYLNWLGAIWRAVVSFLARVRTYITSSRWWLRLEAWEYDPPPMPLSRIVRYLAVIAVMVMGAYWWGRWTAPVEMRMPLGLISQPLPKPADPDVALVAANAALEKENADLKRLADDMTAIAKAKHERLLAVERELAELRSITKLSEDSVVERKRVKVKYVRVKEKTFLCEVAGVCE